MICVVIVTVGIIVQESERDRSVEVDILRNSSQHLCSVVTVLRGVHHRRQLRHEAHSCGDIGINACSHGIAALGIDEDDTVGSTSSVECSGILENTHGGNVVWRDIGKDVVDLIAVQRQPVLLHVLLYPIDDDERLGIGIERRETAHEHRRANAWSGRASDCPDVCTQVVLDIILYSYAVGAGLKSALSCIDSVVGVHGAVLVGQHLYVYLLLVVACIDSHLLRHEAWRMYIEARGKCRNLDIKCTISTSHGGVAFVAQHT